MLVIDNFLIVFSLEVGGKFIGWLVLITNSIVLPLCVVGLVGISVDKNLTFVREQLEQFEIEPANMTDEQSIKRMREYLLVTLVFVIIMSSIYLVASVLLIRGTTNRNHRQIKPAKNLAAFLAIFSVFGLLMRLSVSSMINAVLYIYVFAVIYSLWKKIKAEEESGERRTSEQHFYPIAVQPKV